MSKAAERAALIEQGRREARGTWPDHCEQRAFVDGARWWEMQKTGATMWGSDRNAAEAEALRRYGEPLGRDPVSPHAGAQDSPRPDAADNSPSDAAIPSSLLPENQPE